MANKLIRIADDVDVYAVLDDLRFGNAVEPKRRAVLIDRIDRDASVFHWATQPLLVQCCNIARRVRSHAVVEEFCPPLCQHPGIGAVDTDVLQP